MLMTLLPIKIVVNPLNPENAAKPMFVALITMLVKPLQPKNALLPMLVTLAGMVIEPVRPPGHWMSVVWALLYKTPYKLL